MKEIKLKECPCCEGKAEFECRINFVTEQVRAKCSTCKLSTEWVDESVNYYAKEEAAKVWNLRAQQINLKHQIDLKCPICGGKDIYCEGGIMTKSRIVCTECGTEILIGDKKQVEKIITEIKKLI